MHIAIAMGKIHFRQGKLLDSGAVGCPTGAGVVQTAAPSCPPWTGWPGWVKEGAVCRVLGASEGPQLWGALWIQVLGDIILPLVAKLAQRLSHARARDATAAARSLRMGVALLSKSLLQHLAAMAPLPQFADLWGRALLAFQVGASDRDALSCPGSRLSRNMHDDTACSCCSKGKSGSFSSCQSLHAEAKGLAP